MIHDPLCPPDAIRYVPDYCDWCDLIAKVREDERAKNDGQTVMLAADAEAAIAAARIESQVWHYQQGQRDMLAKCIAAVGEGRVTTESTWSRGYETAYGEVHASLRALQEKP